MWTKYTFVCDPDECDALLEFTARDGYGFPLGVVQMKCPCGRMMNYISYNQDSWDPVETIEELNNFKVHSGISIDSLDVTNITPAGLVKINSNPYT